MGKGGGGIPETFTEHEQDTARRAYEKEMVDRARRTAKISRAEIDEALRNSESGTRPAADHSQLRDRVNHLASEALDRDIRARMEELSPAIPVAAPGRISGLSATNNHEPEIDPHSRPTIDAFRPPPEIAALIETDQQPQPPPPPSDIGRLATAKMPAYQPTEGDGAIAAGGTTVTKPSRSRVIQIPKWFVTLMVVTVIMLIAAAGTVGFYLSHRLNRELPHPR